MRKPTLSLASILNRKLLLMRAWSRIDCNASCKVRPSNAGNVQHAQSHSEYT